MSAERVREFYRRQGIQREKARIVKLIEAQAFIWAGDVKLLTISKDDLLDLITKVDK